MFESLQYLNPFATFEPVTLIPARAIGTFSGYCVIRESATDTLRVTSHPVSEGVNISDHAFKDPAKLSIEFLVGQTDRDLAEVYQELLDLQKYAELIEVVTGKRSYENMVITSITQKTDATTEHVLSISLELQELFIVKIETTTINARSTVNKHLNGVKPVGGKEGKNVAYRSETDYKSFNGLVKRRPTWVSESDKKAFEVGGE